MTTTPVALLAVTALITPGVAFQKTVTKMAEMVTATATIQAIDQMNRIITLRNPDGTEDSLWVPPDVKRFNELKVGETVNARYYESYVFQIRKPGDKPAGLINPGTSVTPGTGANPAATAARQVTTTVEVVAVDPNVPSITVKTADGRTVTRKVEDPKHLEGVNPGDRIDITFTMAAMVSVEPAKQ